ncbi:unnamed protein product [Protopolystoma xenopodis]|uniref:Uncharacterized protein n=1 Tax=Protopolystoma xenopodis TaxID=117903 RepID=A0A3S5BAT1_9PLAT|nr:unnamed protein product [Protopolystoma xenopodis]
MAVVILTREAPPGACTSPNRHTKIAPWRQLIAYLVAIIKILIVVDLPHFGFTISIKFHFLDYPRAASSLLINFGSRPLLHDVEMGLPSSHETRITSSRLVESPDSIQIPRPSLASTGRTSRKPHD